MTIPPASLYRSRSHAAARTTEYLYHQLIPYLGNKRKLLPLIAQAVQQTGAASGTFVDFFAGSGVVSRWAKRAGFRVTANDWEPYAQVLNHSYIQCSVAPSFARFGGMAATYELLNALPPCNGYVTCHLCPADDACPDPDTERLFFTRANGMKIDAIREEIACWDSHGWISDEEKAVLLASLLYAVSYVSNTSGVFKGFHRGWGGKTGTALYRILSDLRIYPPVLWDNRQENRATRRDAQTLAQEWQGQQIEIAYLDPPYNQHPYGSNYHVLNTVALWDKPAVSPGVTGRDKSAIRTDWRTSRRSAYNHRATALCAYETLLQTVEARYILTSYSTDGTIALPDLLAAAAARGHLDCVCDAYKRYRVSAQRRSAKPLNVEFVLIVDTARPTQTGRAEEIAERLGQVEAAALARHPEGSR